MNLSHRLVWLLDTKMQNMEKYEAISFLVIWNALVEIFRSIQNGDTSQIGNYEVLFEEYRIRFGQLNVIGPASVAWGY